MYASVYVCVCVCVMLFIQYKEGRGEVGITFPPSTHSFIKNTPHSMRLIFIDNTAVVLLVDGLCVWWS